MQGLQGPTGAAGPTGSTGPTGAPGPAATTIPFSLSKYGLYLSGFASGDPHMIAFSGFSPAYYSGQHLNEGEWATGIITVNEEMQLGSTFIVPRTATLRNIYVLVSVASTVEFEAGSIIRPFVCIATSNTDDLVFTILQDTMTFTAPYVGGYYATHTVRRGASTGLNTILTEGTQVAIVAGIMNENSAVEQSGPFTVSGGLYLE